MGKYTVIKDKHKQESIRVELKEEYKELIDNHESKDEIYKVLTSLTNFLRNIDEDPVDRVITADNLDNNFLVLFIGEVLGHNKG